MIELEDHPLAEIFPLMTDSEIEDLALSISRTHLREPIVLYQGMILDGRNRYRACKSIGMPPTTRVYDPDRDGSSPLTYVMDANLERRHLTVGQRAAAAATALKAQEAEAKAAAKAATEPAPEPGPGPAPKPQKKKTQKEVAKQMGVSDKSVRAAQALQEANQQEFEAVAKGDKTLHEATESAKGKEAEKDLRKESLPQVAEVCGKEFADHMAAKSILKSDPEIIAFMALDDNEKRLVQPLIAIGWKVKRALAFSLDKLDSSSSIRDLINKAIGAGGDEYVVEIAGWEISAIQINPNPNPEITKTNKN